MLSVICHAPFCASDVINSRCRCRDTHSDCLGLIFRLGNMIIIIIIITICSRTLVISHIFFVDAKFRTVPILLFEQSVSFYLPFIQLLREADYKKREETSRMSEWMIIQLEFHTMRQRDYVISFSCCPDHNHDLCGIRASMMIAD